MMDENQVVEAICRWLKAHGYEIRQSLSTVEKGVDIIAVKEEKRWLIEAKGSTSSRIGSARFGKPYTPNQIVDRVMKGFYTATELAVSPDRNGAQIGLAMPPSATALRYASKVQKALDLLGITMLWVNADSSITEIKPSSSDLPP